MRKHFNLFGQYAIGVLFGWGLIISGMSNPQKILGFLDLAGKWDPSLMFVMMGAVIVGLAGFYVASKRTEAFFGDALHIPKGADITKPLIIGSLIFGAGHLKALVFVVAMLAGMEICERFFTAHKNKPSL